MGQIFVMPEPLWVRVSLLWAAFFALLGALNLYVAFHFETATWVKFKLIGGTGLMFLFIFGQGLYLSKYIKEEPETAEKEGKK
ncbi:MAG: intracellular septation protein, partial [Pseudomonadota bacterium]|jgi:intracellular septation protein